MSDIDPQEFGALQAKIQVLTDEMQMLRESVQRIQTTLDKGQGGLMVLVFAAGSFGSFAVFLVKEILGAG
jgi:prefoldin subunit 5